MEVPRFWRNSSNEVGFRMEVKRVDGEGGENFFELKYPGGGTMVDIGLKEAKIRLNDLLKQKGFNKEVIEVVLENLFD